MAVGLIAMDMCTPRPIYRRNAGVRLRRGKSGLILEPHAGNRLIGMSYDSDRDVSDFRRSATMDTLGNATRVEYHVIHNGEKGRWEVHYGDQRLGYDGWSRDDAEQQARQMAQGNSPASVIVHDKSGDVLREDQYDEAAKSDS